MKTSKLISFFTMLTGILVPCAITGVLLTKINVRLMGSGAPITKPTTGGERPTPTTTPSKSPSGTSGSFRGPTVQGFFGPVQATLTVSRGKIRHVRIMAPQDNPTSAYINSQAVPLLQTETLQAQSANINVISGATVTSDAYYQSLLGALRSAKL